VVDRASKMGVDGPFNHSCGGCRNTENVLFQVSDQITDIPPLESLLDGYPLILIKSLIVRRDLKLTS